MIIIIKLLKPTCWCCLCSICFTSNQTQTGHYLPVRAFSLSSILLAGRILSPYFKRLRSQEMDSKESTLPVYVDWRASSTSNRVVVPTRQLEIDSWAPWKVYKYGLCLCLLRNGANWAKATLKVPKREIFDRSDFPFYRIKSSWVGDMVVKILTYYFNFWGSYAAFSFWRACWAYA